MPRSNSILVVHWALDANNIRYCEVRVHDNADKPLPNNPEIEYTPQGVRISANGLTPGATYLVAARAVDALLESDWVTAPPITLAASDPAQIVFDFNRAPLNTRQVQGMATDCPGEQKFDHQCGAMGAGRGLKRGCGVWGRQRLHRAQFRGGSRQQSKVGILQLNAAATVQLRSLRFQGSSNAIGIVANPVIVAVEVAPAGQVDRYQTVGEVSISSGPPDKSVPINASNSCGHDNDPPALDFANTQQIELHRVCRRQAWVRGRGRAGLGQGRGRRPVR